MVFQPEMELHDHPFKERQFIILAQVFFHHHELEITNRITAGKTFVPADNIYFFVGDTVFHYFSEHMVYSGFHPESQAKINPYNIIRYDMLYFILAGIWIIN